MDTQEYDEILRTLVHTLAHQDVINDDFREFARKQLLINDQLATAIDRHDAMIERLEGILVAIRELLRRGNGRS